MSPARKKPAGPTPVESTRHADKRVNIPTGELADFVADAEKQPGTALYPRDPSLDPQLVWKGKDEQDLAEYLERRDRARLHPGEGRPARPRREPAPRPPAAERTSPS